MTQRRLALRHSEGAAVKKILTGIVAAALSLTVGLGTVGIGTASASGDDGAAAIPTVVGSGLRTKKLCAIQAKVATKVDHVKARLAAKTARLTSARDAAQAAGRTRKVSRIETMISGLNDLVARIDAKYAAYRTWVTANC